MLIDTCRQICWPVVKATVICLKICGCVRKVSEVLRIACHIWSRVPGGWCGLPLKQRIGSLKTRCYGGCSHLRCRTQRIPPTDFFPSHWTATMTIDKIGVKLQWYIPFFKISAKSTCLTFVSLFRICEQTGWAVEGPSISADPVEISNPTSRSFSSSKSLHQKWVMEQPEHLGFFLKYLIVTTRNDVFFFLYVHTIIGFKLRSLCGGQILWKERVQRWLTELLEFLTSAS